MNAIRKILDINEKELRQNVSDQASWHADYQDTAYIYIGNLHESLREEDILKIFSQYGNPTHINLIKDRESGKSKGFCYLKYEDQKSCVLAIDNFNGTLIYERPLKVDHTYYKLLKGQREDDFRVEYPEIGSRNAQQKQIQGVPKLLPYKTSQDLHRNSRDSAEGNNSSKQSHRSIERSDSEEDSGSRKRLESRGKLETNGIPVLSGNIKNDTEKLNGLQQVPNEYTKKEITPTKSSSLVFQEDDFSDPMAMFEGNNNPSKSVTNTIDDDNFEDPMAAFVSSSIKRKPESGTTNNASVAGVGDSLVDEIAAKRQRN